MAGGFGTICIAGAGGAEALRAARAAVAQAKRRGKGGERGFWAAGRPWRRWKGLQKFLHAMRRKGEGERGAKSSHAGPGEPNQAIAFYFALGKRGGGRKG